MLAASIAISTTAKTLDREFTYIIPNEMDGSIAPGCRVIVPFGKGNKLIEGLVLSVSDENLKENIEFKSIIDIVDDGVRLDSSLMELVYFLKDTYCCTTSEAVKTIIPPGVTTKEELYISLGSGEWKEKSKLCELYELLKNKGEIKLKDINNILKNSIKRYEIFKLRDTGAVEIRSETKSRVGIKYENRYELCDSKEAEVFLGSRDKRYEKSREALELLLKENININDIISKGVVSKSVISTLIKRGFVKKVQAEVQRKPYDNNYSYPAPELTEDQKRAIEEIYKCHEKGNTEVLLHGVTGSGKTEIYLRIADDYRRQGKGSIMLVPEIALTPQTVERFKGRFGEKVAVLHSRLSEGERYDEWRRIIRGEAIIVIGARSAVFAPVRNLGLIIIDEEHESTYKSEMDPKYQTSEVAAFRISGKGIIIKGSATPSIESYYSALKGRTGLVTLSRRINNTMPEVKIIDMRDELAKGNRSIFSNELFRLMKKNLASGKQTILFLNRRGFSTFVSCRKCGYVCKCKYCDVALTFHAYKERLQCHYCGNEYRLPDKCPECGSKYIRYFGTGTERIEQEIKARFNDARIIRMDMDTTRKKGEHERLYNQFKKGNADILIGTQMITKGMDFENVTLVGVIAADISLNIPDFRAGERTFQLLTQVSGRAGRGSSEGKVIIQTYEPENYSIQFSSKHDYNGFYEREIAMRKTSCYPPFFDIIYIMAGSENEAVVKEFFDDAKAIVLSKLAGYKFNLLGPAPCSINKIKNIYRWQMIIKGEIKNAYSDINQCLKEKAIDKGIQISMDLNPNNII